MSGRKPYATTDLVPFGVPANRLRPPDALPDAAKRHFTQLVVAMPVGHFRPGDLSYLCRWAALSALAEQAEFEMSQPNGIVAPDGKLSAWVTAHATAVKNLNALALRLRLTPQSRQAKVSKKGTTAASFYDEMRLKPEWDAPP
jgi:phage terminase small subunit